jgi:phage tail sheath protein FI
MEDRVAILTRRLNSTPPGRRLEDELANLIRTTATARCTTPDQVRRPATQGDLFIPPSGYMAGVWSRSDNRRGVHKAPANEEVWALDVRTT